MKKYENDCLNCDNCIHCGKDNSLYIYCDKCNNTDDKIYSFDGEDYCYQCLINELITHHSDEIIGEWFEEIKDFYGILEV